MVGWNEPVNPPILGLFRNDRRNVFLDGNSNLVLRATQEDNTYFSGRVESTMKIGIGHTWEARIKLNCLVPGAWPAYWLVNREPTPDGRGPQPDGEVDILEWYGNGKWAPGTQSTRDPTGEHGARTGGRWTGSGTRTGPNGMTPDSASGETTSTAHRTSRFLPLPSTGCGPSTHPTTCCTRSSTSRSASRWRRSELRSLSASGHARRLHTGLVKRCPLNSRLLAAGALLAGLGVAAPAHADPPSYGSNGVFGGDKPTDGWATASIPPGRYRVDQSPSMYPYQSPAWFLAAVQQPPLRRKLPGHIIASGNAVRDQSTFVDILPSDVAVSLNNVTLTIAG